MKILGFIVSLVLFVGGIYLLANAFYVLGFESVVFVGGILVSTIGLVIPFHILTRVDA